MDPALPLLARPDLAFVDPVELNLLVAKGVSSLTGLDISRYAGIVDGWVDEFRRTLPGVERLFPANAGRFRNDINFFRLVVLYQFIDETLGVAYKEDQREVRAVAYTDPADLFLHGVIDTRRGTCGNMAALYVAMCWRLKWPVSLACVGVHYIARYDDGRVTHNVEATQAGGRGLKSDPDDYLIEHGRITPKALSTGSDLRALSARETLGTFYGLRARHHTDCGRAAEAEKDYLLARYLFPNNHHLYRNAVAVQLDRGAELFDKGDHGHPLTLIHHVEATFGSPFHAYDPPPPPPGRQVFQTGGDGLQLIPIDWSVPLNPVRTPLYPNPLLSRKPN